MGAWWNKEQLAIPVQKYFDEGEEWVYKAAPAEPNLVMSELGMLILKVLILE